MFNCITLIAMIVIRYITFAHVGDQCYRERKLQKIAKNAQKNRNKFFLPVSVAASSYLLKAW